MLWAQLSLSPPAYARQSHSGACLGRPLPSCRDMLMSGEHLSRRDAPSAHRRSSWALSVAERDFCRL